MNSGDEMEIYYWSKLAKDENLAGGEIRGGYMIRELVKISRERTMVLTPDMVLPIGFVLRHQTLSKIPLMFAVPIYIVKKVLKRGARIKFIYCTTCYTWDILPAILMKFMTSATVVCVSHDTPKQLEGFYFYRNSEKLSLAKSILSVYVGKSQEFLLRYVDIPVAMSKFAMDFFEPDGIRERAILASSGVPNVIEEDDLHGEREYDIVYLGRVVPRKNVDVIFRCLSLSDFPKKIRVLIITNTEKSNVMNTIEPYLDHSLIDLAVRFNATEQEKFDLLKRAKLYISLSRDETFSSATLEAASQGDALILSDYTFFRNIYGGAAIFVDPNDLDAIWKEIRRLLTDNSSLLSLQRKSLKVAGKYIYRDIATREYSEIINRISYKEMK